MSPPSIVRRMVSTFNAICPVRVRFARAKIDHRCVGRLVRVSWEPTRRKGGGFVFWIEYNGSIQRHTDSLKSMLCDYIASINSDRNLKRIKNFIINPTKDLHILLPHSEPQPLGQIFPTKIRELKNYRACMAWVVHIKERKFQCTSVLPKIEGPTHWKFVSNKRQKISADTSGFSQVYLLQYQIYTVEHKDYVIKYNQIDYHITI